LFIGRFISRKSLDILLEAYKLYSQSILQPEKLILIGQGELEHLIPKSPNIIVYNYLDQTAIAELMSTVKAFILPSRFEAWGVVVHEAAAAGMPIITTTNTGASTSFVKHNYNGRVIDNLNPNTLARSITFINELDMKDLNKFGKRSYELSKSITPELGATQLLSLVKQFEQSKLFKY
jgi:glycosyltransferase involved in cell wall biosynthesis